MKAKRIVYCSLLASFTAVCSQISIPLNPVPINLALFAVMLCGGLLGKKDGTVSVMVYILVGAVGVPVFASLRGGFGVLAGPTGGYIVGYVLTSYITGCFFEKSNRFCVLIPGMILGVLLCYAFGTVWYMFVSGTKFLTALLPCLLLFPFDFVKIILAYFVVKFVRRTGVLG